MYMIITRIIRNFNCFRPRAWCVPRLGAGLVLRRSRSSCWPERKREEKRKEEKEKEGKGREKEKEEKRSGMEEKKREREEKKFECSGFSG